MKYVEKANHTPDMTDRWTHAKPGDWWFAENKTVILMACAGCGQIISVRTPPWTFHNIDQPEKITIKASIRHIGPECHYFVTEGKIIPS